MEIKDLLAKLNVPEMTITIDLGDDDIVFAVKNAQYAIIKDEDNGSCVSLMLKPDRTKPKKVIPQNVISRIFRQD